MAVNEVAICNAASIPVNRQKNRRSTGYEIFHINSKLIFQKISEADIQFSKFAFSIGKYPGNLKTMLLRGFTRECEAKKIADALGMDLEEIRVAEDSQ